MSDPRALSHQATLFRNASPGRYEYFIIGHAPNKGLGFRKTIYISYTEK